MSTPTWVGATFFGNPDHSRGKVWQPISLRPSTSLGTWLLGPSPYQLAFLTPGISPFEANSLKQILHVLKSRMYPLLRPQRKQRRTILVEYLAFFFDLSITDFLAIFAQERSDWLQK